MNFLTIFLIIVILIEAFIVYMAVRKIKWQEKTILERDTKIAILQRQLEVQGKIDE